MFLYHNNKQNKTIDQTVRMWKLKERANSFRTFQPTHLQKAYFENNNNNNGTNYGTEEDWNGEGEGEGDYETETKKVFTSKKVEDRYRDEIAGAEKAFKASQQLKKSKLK